MHKRITSLILASVILISGCSAKTDTDTVTSVASSAGSSITQITQTSEAATESTPSETTEQRKFEFNPHVYSATIAKAVPQEHWDAFYNLCDALRKGETTFKCSSKEAYEWATDIGQLNQMFPAACTKVVGKGYKDGVGEITYKMPVEEFVKRQADFETLVTDILNETLEYDDSEFEKCLKLYVYFAKTYHYGNDHPENEGSNYATFTTKKGICIDFASIYAYLLMQVGVDATEIGCSETMDHAWTYVVVNGKAYHIDTTWTIPLDGDNSVYVLLDYFMMSDDERIADGCYVNDLLVSSLPKFFASNYPDISFAATDNHYNLRRHCEFSSLDEENKILHYLDENGEEHEMHYE